MELDNILREYAKLLKRFFSSRVKNRSDADDLVQEVLRKTLTHFKKIEHPEKFRAWLFSVARNTLVDYYRKSAKYINKELDLVAQELDESDEVEKELSSCVRLFVRQLPDEYRQALEEVEFKGKSQKQVAANLGMTYSALKSRVQRGRALLRDLLKQCCHYELGKKGGIVDFKLKGELCNSCV